MEIRGSARCALKNPLRSMDFEYPRRNLCCRILCDAKIYIHNSIGADIHHVVAKVSNIVSRHDPFVAMSFNRISSRMYIVKGLESGQTAEVCPSLLHLQQHIFIGYKEALMLLVMEELSVVVLENALLGYCGHSG